MNGSTLDEGGGGDSPVVSPAPQRSSSSDNSLPQDSADETVKYHRSLFRDHRVLGALPEEEKLLNKKVMEGLPVAAAAEVHENINDIEEEPSASFHIPESNASDIYSDCESAFGGGRSGIFMKSEPLTSKQQVALWLTRTSMTNLSSMPSLKSLINFNKKNKNSSSKKSNQIERNLSTKSLTNTYQSRDIPIVQPMRKCETVIALSGMANVHPSKPHQQQSVIRNKSSTGCCSYEVNKRKSSSNSRFDLFHRLSRASNGAGSMTGGAAGSVHGGSITPGGYNYAQSTCESPFPGMIPINRHRSKSSIICSRCTSVMSVNTSRMTSRAPSQLSLLLRNNEARGLTANTEAVCKICLADYPLKEMVKLDECGCYNFCRDCMIVYITMEITEGAYDISCPDAECDKENNNLTMIEMEKLVSKELIDKHKTFRLNTEVSLDSNRAWCPQVGCDTICHICSSSAGNTPTPVQCPSCDKEFCSSCSATWHPNITCQENGSRLYKAGALSWICDDDPDGNIKQCPVCKVPIERNAGCAQMMCKKCKHVFCWYCQTSLDDDFLLRHYDSGKCKGKLGHSRASVLWHRAQVIAIFAGFGVLLLVASPILLLVAPCLLCCRCKACHKLSENINDGVNEVVTNSSFNEGTSEQVAINNDNQ